MQDARFSAEELTRGERLFAGPWRFVTGAAVLDALPAGARPEFAFAGRSNVGKSSLINALTRRKDLARTSNAPGRTQELNFYAPSRGELLLVDMPGYGFATAPKEKILAWRSLVAAYLYGRPTVRRVLLLVDARHGIMAGDREIMGVLDAAAVSYQAVLTKADKVSRPALEAVALATAAALEGHGAAFPHALATSAKEGTGLAELRATLACLVGDA
jgi:GTP-binding protein